MKRKRRRYVFVLLDAATVLLTVCNQSSVATGYGIRYNFDVINDTAPKIFYASGNNNHKSKLF
ncbi:MAG: hypothetical protein HW406_4 [Candidatus Brocadiaceae bacterium]|nr:hypothetical protein [Candidatus Brocadiaceae bacterium]